MAISIDPLSHKSHSGHYVEKGTSFTRLLDVAGLEWGKRKLKLRSVGDSLLQKSARGSDEVANTEIFARMIRQVRFYQLVSCRYQSQYSP